MTPVTETRGEWLSIHVFYAASPKPMLVDCIGPLVAGLTEDGLLAGYFFINYWLEGPHVRLRLRPSSAAATPLVRARAEAAIDEFLRARPALYAMDAGFRGELYNTLFDLEFPGGAPAELRGPDGQMIMQRNNSYSYRPYEPEYGKYGGAAGVELAEWHFRHSSDLVIKALRTMNLHMRPVLFGTAAQLMMVMSGCFLPDRAELADYLDRYYVFWHKAFAGTNYVGSDEYSRNYDEAADGLRRRFTATLDLLGLGQAERLPTFLRGWAAHCLELKAKVEDLAVRGELVLRSWDGTRDEQVTDPAAALNLLLSPYLHMTNNRFHVTLRDEAYLSYLLGRALRESITTGRETS